MIRSVVDVSLRRRSLILALAVGVMVFAFTQLDEARVETLPEFTPPYVEVQTEALGLSASEVEQLITVPLEADLLNGVAFVEEIRSESMPSLSSIVMTFEPGTDILDARQLVQERLTQAHGLPNVSRAPAMVQPLSSESRVMMIGLTSDQLNTVELGVLARWTIRPKLMGVEGVANVAVWGAREQQLQVQVLPDALVEHDVSLQDVTNTTGNALWVTPLSFLEASTPGMGGFIDGPNQRIDVRHLPAISTPADLSTVVIEGHPDVTLGDVAVIVEDHQQLIGDAVVGDEEGLYLIIEKFPWNNTIETTEAVEAALEELAPGLTEVTLETDLFRPASYLERAIDNIATSVVAAVVLVAIASIALLRSWREGLTALISMILASSLAASVLFILGITFDNMMLAGIGIGVILIIDDAVRNVHEQVKVDPTDGRALGRRLAANSDSLVYAGIVLVILLVPSYFMDGAAGEFVPDILIAVVIAVASAYVVAISITPALGSLLIVRDEATSAHADEGAYAAAVGRVGAMGPSVLAVGAALLVVGALMIPFVDREFIPRFQQTDLVVDIDTAAGVSLPETRRLASSMANEIAALPGVEAAGTQVGRAILSDEVTNVNSAEVWVRIGQDADYDRTIDAVQQVVDTYPGIGRPLLNTYTNERVNAELRQEKNDLVARLYGEDPEILTTLGQELQTLVGGVDGVENARVLLPVAEPTIEIEVDIEQAAELQVKPGDVRRAAATLLSGIEVGSLFEEQKVFEVVVWSVPELRQSITDVENLQIDTPAGDRIRLADVADVRVRPNERIIEREAVSRYVDIVADVPGGDIEAAENQIQELIADRGLPFEFHVGFQSDRADLDANWRQTVVVSAAAFITILLLLQASFSSFRLAVLMILAMPTAAVGSLVAVVISGGVWSIGSFAGTVAIAGLTLRSGLALLRRYELLQLGGGMELGPELVIRGAQQLFRPAAAALGSVAALSLAFVVRGTPAGFEVVTPMAVAVLGGVFTAAIVTLFLVPSAYGAIARPAVMPELFGREPIIDLDSETDTTDLVTT